MSAREKKPAQPEILEPIATIELIDRELVTSLRKEAAARDMSLQSFTRRLLGVISTDGLFAAVMDDDVTPPRRS
jgi:hypothetical protein